MADKTVCDLHSKKLDRKTKTSNIPYHWIDKDVTDFSNMCYGKDRPEEVGNVMPSVPEPSPPVEVFNGEEPNVPEPSVVKENFEEEEKVEPSEKDRENAMWERKDRRITRVAIAKSFIYNGIDFDTALKENDLDKWFKWVWEEKE